MSEKRQARAWLMPAFKIAAVGLLVWGVHTFLRGAMSQLAEHTWHVLPGWLVVSGLVYLLALLPSAFFWHSVLVAAQQTVTLGRTVHAFYLSQLGKYAPGKAMVVVIRASLLRGPGAQTAVIAASVFFETFSTMAVGALVSLIVLVAWYPHVVVEVSLWNDTQVQLPLYIGAAILLLGMGAPAMPRIFEGLTRLVGADRINPAAAHRLGAIGGRVLLTGWPVLAIGWVLQGLSLLATLRALEAPDVTLADLPLVIAAVALAVVAGFIFLIPGGLGVRELVLLPLLAPRFGEANALVSAVILRVVWLVVELIISAILYGVRPRAVGREALQSLARE